MRTSSLILVFMVLVGVSEPARADKSAAQQAKEHLATAQRMFEVQRYDKAIEQLQEAYVLDPKPEYLYAIGQAFRLEGDCAKAITAYERYLKTNPVKVEADKATTNIERCKADLAAKPPTLPPPPAPPLAPVPTRTPTPAPNPGATSGDDGGWTRDYAGHALVGGGVVAATVGVVLYLNGRSAILAIGDSPTYGDFATRHADLASAQLRQRIGITSLIAGAALVTGGVIHYRLHDKRATSLSAAIAPGQAAVVFATSF